MTKPVEPPMVAHVVCANDFPLSVYFDAKKAESFVKRSNTDDEKATRASTMGKKRIYYHVHAVPVRT